MLNSLPQVPRIISSPFSLVLVPVIPKLPIGKPPPIVVDSRVTDTLPAIAISPSSYVITSMFLSLTFTDLIPRPSFPSVPSRPSLPSSPLGPAGPCLPSDPSFPSVPSKPSRPSLPSIPSRPSRPSLPSLPFIPGEPCLPTSPCSPCGPCKPSTPSLPSRPSLGLGMLLTRVFSRASSTGFIL